MRPAHREVNIGIVTNVNHGKEKKRRGDAWWGWTSDGLRKPSGCQMTAPPWQGIDLMSISDEHI